MPRRTGKSGDQRATAAGEQISPEPLPTEERTFLIADVRNYTAFTQEQGDQAAARLTMKFAALAAASTRQHQGRLLSQRGDEIVAVFASPRRALRTALALITICAEETSRDPSLPLHVGVGVAAGKVVLVGEDYRGAALNLASRLCSLAREGEALASQPVVRQARQMPGVTFVERGAAQLKGLQDGVAIYSVLPAGQTGPAEPTPVTPRPKPHPWLPAPLTPIIGREADVALVQKLLKREDARLVTITGPGGVGKTRLSVAIGASLADDFPDGVYFVELAAVTDPQLVPQVIAQRLGIALTSGQPALEQIAAATREKRMLWVLDNFEQLLDGALIVRDALEACPSVKALVTSRATLRLRGEWEAPLSPLELPDVDLDLTPDDALTYPAVRLFVDRAQAASPTFELDETTLTPAVGICRRLDGLPLALELAAARIRVMPLPALLDRLSDATHPARLKTLTGGARDMPERHQTLRAAIEWSYELLAPGEQALFRALATFAGGATFEAVEAAVHASAHPDTDVFAGLATLVEQSLLTQREEEGKPRYLMLETIREYGLEQLSASDDAEAVNDGHARFYLNLAEEAAPKLTGPRQQEWLQRLEREQDNMRAALRWTQERDLVSALRIASALYRFWETRGYAVEGRRWLDGLLASAESEGIPLSEEVYSKAHIAAAYLAYVLQDYSQAGTLLDQVLESVDVREHPSEVAEALNLQGLVALDRGDREKAKQLFMRSVELRRHTGEKRGLAMSLLNLGSVIGDNNESAQYRQESLDLFRDLGDTAATAHALNNLGNAHFGMGDFKRAANCFNESLSLYRSLGGRRGIAMALNNLGQVKRILGNYGEAVHLFEETLAIRRSLEDKRGEVLALLNLGNLAYVLSDRARALETLEASLGLSKAIQYTEVQAYIVASLGRVHILFDAAKAQALLEESISESTLIGNREIVGLCLLYYGHFLLFRNKFSEALVRYTSSIQMLDELQYAPECLESVALALVGQARLLEASRLLGGANHWRQALHAPIPPIDEPALSLGIQLCRQGLGEDEFDLTYKVGQQLSLDNLLAIAASYADDTLVGLN
jgi:predicted ATPase/class 3 adenylate cyclase